MRVNDYQLGIELGLDLKNRSTATVSSTPVFWCRFPRVDAHDSANISTGSGEKLFGAPGKHTVLDTGIVYIELPLSGCNPVVTVRVTSPQTTHGLLRAGDDYYLPLPIDLRAIARNLPAPHGVPSLASACAKLKAVSHLAVQNIATQPCQLETKDGKHVAMELWLAAGAPSLTSLEVGGFGAGTALPNLGKGVRLSHYNDEVVVRTSTPTYAAYLIVDPAALAPGTDASAFSASLFGELGFS
jgi:hypothetical protein